MYRRPILWTLYGAVDFLKVLKIAVVGGGGGGVLLVLGHNVPSNRVISSLEGKFGIVC